MRHCGITIAFAVLAGLSAAAQPAPKAPAATAACTDAPAGAPTSPLARRLAAVLAGPAPVPARWLQGTSPAACVDGAALLTHALLARRWDVVDSLLAAGAPIDAPRDAAGLTPLMRAADAGRFPEALRLLTRGADATLATPAEGFTVLHFAAGAEAPDDEAARRAQSMLVHALLWQPVAANRQAAGGVTALQLAVRRGHKPLVALLLAYGADPNLADARGRRPLDWAMADRRGDLSLMLLEAGAQDAVPAVASPAHLLETGDIAALRGLVAANAAAPPASGQRLLLLALLHDRAEAIAALVRWGADPNGALELPGTDSAQRHTPTPLALALQRGRFACAQALLESGADARRSHPGDDMNALMHAVSVDDPALQSAARPLLQHLLRAGVLPLEATDAAGRTALHHAALHGNVVAVQLLLSHGADAARRDGRRRSALDHARSVGSAPVVALLRQAGR